MWLGLNNLCLPWVQVHVGWLPGGTAILAFRGTESAQDGLQDVKIIRKNVDYMQEVFPGVQAHTGDQTVHFAGGDQAYTSAKGASCKNLVPSVQAHTGKGPLGIGTWLLRGNGRP